MILPKERGTGGISPVDAIRERPLLFAVLAMAFFSTALFAARLLIEPPLIEAKMRIEMIDLDREAGDPGDLIKSVPHDIESLKIAILGESLQGAANVGNHQQDAAWHDRLTILPGSEDGEFIIGLDGGDGLAAGEALNTRLQAFAGQQNRRRTEQKAEASKWAEQQRAFWQARVDQAKSAIVDNPFDPALPRAADRSESGRLMRLMIDATIEARTAQQGDNREAVLERDPHDDDSGLAAETARLNEALNELEAGRAAQLHHGTVLKEAEAGLAKLLEDTRYLMRQEGILDRPAATILTPATSTKAASPGQSLRAAGWQVLLPTLAVASVILALIGTLIACRLWPRVDLNSGDLLNDPHWPLPSDAHRDLST